MSDIAFYGIASFIAALVFFALAALLLLVLVGVVIVHLVRKTKPWTPAVLGLLASMVTLVAGAGLVMIAADRAPRETDEALVLWGPGVVLLAFLGGGAAWFVAHTARRTRT